MLESRLAKRAETVIGDRVRDAHFKVVVAALRLLTRLVEAHAGLMAGLLSTLLPPVGILLGLVERGCCGVDYVVVVFVYGCVIFAAVLSIRYGARCVFAALCGACSSAFIGVECAAHMARRVVVACGWLIRTGAIKSKRYTVENLQRAKEMDVLFLSLILTLWVPSNLFISPCFPSSSFVCTHISDM